MLGGGWFVGVVFEIDSWGSVGGSVLVEGLDSVEPAEFVKLVGRV